MSICAARALPADLAPAAELRRAVARGLTGVVGLALAVWCVLSVRGSQTDDAASRSAVAHWRVVLDQAPPADLELLPGVGPTLARRIRAVCGEPAPVRAEDLLRVARLGPVGRKRIAPWVVFGAPDATDREPIGVTAAGGSGATRSRAVALTAGR